MKKILLLLIVLSIGHSINAQVNDLRVVSPAGSTHTGAGVSLDWTLGEVVIQTLENPTHILSNGFHQPTYTIVSIAPIPEEIGNLDVYPNPFSDFFEITMSYDQFEKGFVELFDMHGRSVSRTPFEGKDITEKYETSKLSPGSYLLVISLSNHPYTHTFQLVKTQ